MDITTATELIKQTILEALDEPTAITDDMRLIGSGSLLDSMKLVEVCLALEDLADDRGFEFDWTSDSAMSKSRSMFRTVESLAQEFFNQSKGDA